MQPFWAASCIQAVRWDDPPQEIEMATNQNLPATDSAAELHKLIGEDSTATFESDPRFAESTPGADASSENLQTREDRNDIRNSPSLKLRDSDDVEDEEDEEDDEDLEDDEDDEDDDEDEDDLDEEDDEDDDYEDDDDEDEGDEEEEEE